MAEGFHLSPVAFWAWSDAAENVEVAGALIDGGDTGKALGLLLAVSRLSYEKVDFLVDLGTDMNFRFDDTSALNVAVRRGRLGGVIDHHARHRIIRRLLEKGADVNSPHVVNQGHRYFPIHAAQSIDDVQALLTHGAEVDKQDHSGNTKLHRAAASGNHELAELLIAAGANPDARNNEGETPRDVARCGVEDLFD